MGFFKRIKTIRMKIILGFSIAIFLTWLYGSYNFLQTRDANEKSASLISQIEVITLSQQLANTINEQIADARGYILTGSAQYKNSFNENTAVSKEIAMQLEQTPQYAELEVPLMVANNWQTLVTDEIFANHDNGNKDTAFVKLTGTNTTTQELNRQFDNFALLIKEQLDNEADALISLNKRNLIISIVFSYIVTFIGIGVALVIGTMISKQTKQLLAHVSKLAEGDLSLAHNSVQTRDEIAQLSDATNHLADNLNVVVHEIKQTSDTLHDSSSSLMRNAHDVNDGMNQTSQAIMHIATGAETQASATGHLRDVIIDFSHSIQVANDNTQTVKGYAENVREMTVHGQQLMNETELQMGRIDEIVQHSVQRVNALNDETAKISALVNVITDIAAQTDLLALNAAIEAARAGEYGKGFAVVADEVRKLSEQVSVSVADISTIVHSIQNQTTSVTKNLEEGYAEVEKGTNQTAISSKNYREITAAVAKMVNNIEDVSDTLSNFTVKAAEMNNSIEEIANITQQSSASAQQTAAAVQQVSSSMEIVTAHSAQLDETAKGLQTLVTRFKLS